MASTTKTKTAKTSSKNVTRVLLTGGPHGGKSSAMFMLKQKLQSPSLAVVTVPESATAVMHMLQLQLAPARVSPCTVPVLSAVAFQTAILQTQLAAEKAAETVAADLLENGQAEHVLILFDRGILDGRAFTVPDGAGPDDLYNPVWAQATLAADVTLSTATLRDARMEHGYDGVLWLESLASYEDGKMYQHASGGGGCSGAVASTTAGVLQWLYLWLVQPVAALFGFGFGDAAARFNTSPLPTRTQRLQSVEAAKNACTNLALLYCGSKTALFMPVGCKRTFSDKVAVCVFYVELLLQQNVENARVHCAHE